MITKDIFLQYLDKSVRQFKIEIAERGPWRIQIPDLNLTFESGDLFESLYQLRKKLEEQNILVLCQGSRKNVRPSGMSVSMGGGRKAYVLEMGKQAQSKNLVDIFDYAEPELISTTTEQKVFFSKWFESLNPKKR